MTIDIDNLSGRRDGVVAHIDIAGHLPSPAYEITALTHSQSHTGSSTIAIATQKNEGMFPQMIKRVRESVSLGRVGPGSYPVQVTCNGAVVHMAKITL